MISKKDIDNAIEVTRSQNIDDLIGSFYGETVEYAEEQMKLMYPNENSDWRDKIAQYIIQIVENEEYIKTHWPQDYDQDYEEIINENANVGGNY